MLILEDPVFKSCKANLEQKGWMGYNRNPLLLRLRIKRGLEGCFLCGLSKTDSPEFITQSSEVGREQYRCACAEAQGLKGCDVLSPSQGVKGGQGAGDRSHSTALCPGHERWMPKIRCHNRTFVQLLCCRMRQASAEK